ncbi:MAG: hypothetical protein K0R00_402 [Herbinix sp.]|jgi:hypothetical protein|nr:hypothetical protein [Herbinix sp.]
MLGKLLKHELNATSRLLIPLYVALAVLTFVNHFALYIEAFHGILAGIKGFLTFAYVVALIGIVVVTFILIIQRFYKNLVTDEGYLMFTLPVKSHELINSKLIVALLWILASIAAVILSLIIVFYRADWFSDLPTFWGLVKAEFQREFGSSSLLLVIELIVILITAILNNILLIYVSIAIGQLINGHKLIGSFGAYIGIYTGLQILVIICMGILSLIFKQTINDITIIPEVVLPLMILYTLVLNVIFFFVTNFIFKRKLNLD